MPTDSGSYTPQTIERRRRMAQALLEQGTTPQQIAHPMQGVAQMAQAFMGRRDLDRLDKAETEGRSAANQKVIELLSGGENPEVPRDNRRIAAELMGNPWTEELGQKLLGHELTREPGIGGGTSLAGYNQAKQEGYKGGYLDYKREFEGREANSPSSVQEWNMFNALSPEDQQRFLEMKRNVPIETINQVPSRVLAGGEVQQLSSLPSEAAAAQQVNAAKAEGTETGQARGTAIANLPSIQNTTRAALETVDKMLQHPGMGTATGLSSVIDPRNYIPGTDARDFRVLRNQAQGQVFLDAFQALKGGGTVTEVEGLKAEQAKARMDTAQSDEEFRSALNDYASALRRGLQLAEQRAGMVTGGSFGGQPASAPGAQQQPGAVSWSDL